MPNLKLECALSHWQWLEVECWAPDGGDVRITVVSKERSRATVDAVSLSLMRADVPKLIALLTAYLEVG